MPAHSFNYDEISDTLYIAFEPGKKATGIELNDHILLRINKKERKAIGLTFFNYSILVQRTEIGPRSFPLTGLAELSAELREIVVEILLQPPVSDISGETAILFLRRKRSTCSSTPPASPQRRSGQAGKQVRASARKRPESPTVPRERCGGGTRAAARESSS